MTEFLVAVFIRSLVRRMSDRELRKSIVIDIPINLRNFFPSETTRNFFAILPVTYRPNSRDDSLEMICEVVSREFSQVITKENLLGKINSLGSFERNMPMRVLIPVFIKDPGLQFCNFLAKRFVTGCFSNLGRIILPESFTPYVEQVGVYSSTLTVQAECCTYGDKLSIGFTDAFLDVSVVYDFFHMLNEMGVEIELHTNTPVEEKQTSKTAAGPNTAYIADPTVPRTLTDAECISHPQDPEAQDRPISQDRQYSVHYRHAALRSVLSFNRRTAVLDLDHVHQHNIYLERHCPGYGHEDQSPAEAVHPVPVDQYFLFCHRSAFRLASVVSDPAAACSAWSICF